MIYNFLVNIESYCIEINAKIEFLKYLKRNYINDDIGFLSYLHSNNNSIQLFNNLLSLFSLSIEFMSLNSGK